MKNNPIKNLNKLVVVVTAIILLLSCQQGEPYNLPPGSTHIELSVSALNSGPAVVSNDPASAIKSLCILQFYANGSNFGTLRHVGIGKETGVNSGKYGATLLQSNNGEAYKLVVLANLPNGYGIFQKMGGKSYSEVQQACLSEVISGQDNLPTFDGNNPFPMFGVAKDGDPIVIGSSLELTSVPLVRAVARVDVGVGTKNPDDDTWSKGDVNFNMTQIQIWKGGRQYAYLPAENKLSFGSGTLTVTGPSPAGDKEEFRVYGGSGYITDGTYCSGKIYLPEADLLWGDVNDPNHTNRTAIIVGGVNRTGSERFYRMDFTYDQPADKIDILRNHVYQFTIKSVTDEGYATARDAYEGKRVNLTFVPSITDWIPGVDAKPLPQEGYLMVYGGQSGNVTTGNNITIKQKSTYWEGENSSDADVMVDYNTFYGEVPGNLKRSPAYPNGDIYPDIRKLTSVEGAYPQLMVATDDIYTADGTPSVHWKDGLVYTAFDLCRNYSGLGYSDWRLPRASELFLMFLNRKSLEKQRGFTAFSGTYWSGSEKDAATVPVASEAWVMNFSDGATSRLTGGNKVNGSYKIRCVRQVSDTKRK